MSEVKVIDEKGISYYLIDDEKYMRVTTPLGIFSDRYLIQWESRVGKAKAGRVRDRAGRKGTILHSYFDHICKGIDYEVPKNHEKYQGDIDAFTDWAEENIEEVLHTEVHLSCKKYLVAGTCDFIGRIKGYDGICIVDWKTGQVKREAFLQAAAYRYLAGETLDINIEDITHRLIVQVKDGKVKVSPVNKKDPKNDTTMDTDWEVYKNLLSVYRWWKK